MGCIINYVICSGKAKFGDVLVVVRANSAAVLYDIVNISKKNITEAQVAMASKNSQRRQDTSVTNNSIQQDTTTVNNNSMQNSAKNSLRDFTGNYQKSEIMEKAERNSQKITYDEAFEEFVADSMERMLADGEAYEKLIKLRNKDQSLFEKLLEGIKSLVSKIKKEYAHLKPDSLEGKLVADMTDSFEKIQDLFVNALNTASNVAHSAEKNTATENDGVKMQIRYTTSNQPVVVIENDILEGIKKSDWVTAVKNTITSKFSKGIPISGKLIKVNLISKKEFTNSKNTKYYRTYDKQIYKDKFKSANNLDEIILASTNYINEDLNHKRNDNIVEFARGEVLMRVHNNDYSAKVIIAFTTGQNMLLYDLIDFQRLNFEIKKADAHTAQTQSVQSSRTSASTDNSVSQENTTVNNNSMQSNAKNSLRDFTGNYQKSEIVDSLNKSDIDTAESVKYSNRTKYNEFSSLVMQWANSASTEIGDVKIFARKSDDFHLFEKTEDGCIEITSGKYKKVRVEYERAINNTDKQFYEYSDIIRTERNGGVQHSISNGDRRYADSGIRPFGREGLQTDSAGNNKHLRSGNKEKSVKFSDPTTNSDEKNKFSLRDYSYKALTSKPDMEITIVNDKVNYEPNKLGRENVINRGLLNAAEIGYKDKFGNVFVSVNDINTDIMVSKKGLRHSLDRRFSILAPVTKNIGAILKNAIRINELTPKIDEIEKSYLLIGIAKNSNNEPYVISFVINKASNELMSVDVLYAVNAKKEATALIEPELSSQSDVSLTASTISISNLLEYVNKYFPDILPEDVLKHFGHTERPNGKLGESALFSQREKSIYEKVGESKKLFNTVERLTKENEYLKQLVKLQNKRTHGKILDMRTVERQALRIKKKTGSKLDTKELTLDLHDIYSDIVNADNSKLWQKARNIATKLLDAVPVELVCKII